MRQTIRSQRARMSREAHRLKNLIRRFRVAATAGAQWLLEGYQDQAGNTDADEVEVFPGVGLYARPHADHRAEAIVLKVGGKSGHPVIVATRNHDAVKTLIAGEGLEEDETAIFTSQSMVKIKADGTVEIGTIGGARGALATKADLDSLKSTIEGWTPAPNDGGAALKTALTSLFASWPTGTQKLEAE